MTPYTYEFGPFKFDPNEHSLFRDGVPIPLTEKALQVLLVLVDRSGHLVERSEIVNAVWAGAFVEEGNLTVTISMLRKALRDDRGKNRFIETIPKRGYRFLPNVVRRPIHSSTFKGTTSTPLVDLDESATLPESTFTAPALTVRSPRMYVAGIALLLLALPVVIGLAPRRAHSRPPAPKAPQHVSRFVAVAPLNVAGPSSKDPQIGAAIAADLARGIGSRTGLKAQTLDELLRSPQNNSNANLPEDTQEVDVLLTGSINMSRGKARLTTRLSNSEGETLWSGVYDAPLGQIRQLEGQIESTVNERMLLLSPIAQSTHSSSYPVAQRLYLAGRYFWDERTESGLRYGIACFQQAIFRDPNFAEAYAGLADSYALLDSYAVEPSSEAYPNAEAAAQRALQLNADLAEAHIALGVVALYYEWNWRRARQEFKKAIDISPRYSGGYAWDSLYLAAVGETSQALHQALKAQEMNPASMTAIMHLAGAYYWARQYDKAAAMYRYALTQDSTFARAHSRLGIVLIAQKDYAGAVRELREAERQSGPDPYTDGLIGYAEALRGNIPTTRKILDELTIRSKHEYIPPFSLALLYLGLGDREKALDWLNRARQDRSTYLIYAKVAPLLDPLRSDQRFSLLLGNMGLQALQVDHSPRTPSPSTNGETQALLINSDCLVRQPEIGGLRCKSGSPGSTF